MVATSAESTGQGNLWRLGGVMPAALALGFIVAVFSMAFWPSIQWMAGEWSGSSGALSHGYLVSLISAILFIRAVPAVASRQAIPAWWMLPIVLGLSLVWLLGFVAVVVAAQTVVLPALLFAVIVTVFGWHASRPLFFPILYLYFALPALEHFQFIFQNITVWVTTILLHVADVPALVVGNFVQLASGTFEIAGACSGLSFIVAGLSLGVLYSHLFYTRPDQYLTLICLTFLAAVVGNWIRVFGIIYIGYLSDMQSPLVEDHLTMGWILFAILMAPVFYVAIRLENRNRVLTRRESPSSIEDTSPAFRSWSAVVLALFVLVVGPGWALTIERNIQEIEGSTLILPPGSGQWSGPYDNMWDWAPEFAGEDAERLAQYENDTDVVLVYTNLYLKQEQAKELIYLFNSVVGNWRQIDADISIGDKVITSGGLQFAQLVAENSAGQWLIWYRYQVAGTFEISDAKTKILQALMTLQGNPETGVIALATPCKMSCMDALQTLEGFVDSVGHSIRTELNRDTK